MATPVWHGDQRESDDLVSAVENNCGCKYAENGQQSSTCVPHTMLTTDQRALDGLLFMRRRAAELRREEFTQPRQRRDRKGEDR